MTFLRPVTHGRPSPYATRIPTWKPPESADSLPKKMMSNGPFAASSARIASSRAEAVDSPSHSWPSVCRWIARSMPRAMASRSWSTASGGPRVRTTESPLFASISRTPSSTPHSSCGLIVKPRCCVLIARASSVNRMRPPVIGTRLMQAAIRTPYARMRVFSGSNRGVAPATATLTGYRSPMYSTRS